MAEPALANLPAVSRAQFGDGYCGGRIEQSMRRVINGESPPFAAGAPGYLTSRR